MNLKLEDTGDWTEAELEECIREIMGSNRLLSMATVRGSEPHINTAFYCFDEELNIFILTPPNTVHGQNLEEKDSVAVDIHDSHQEWVDDKQGLQIFGSARKVDESDEALRLYTEMFSAMEDVASGVQELAQLDSIFYKFKPERIKVFDEPRFGTETWIKVKIREE